MLKSIIKFSLVGIGIAALGVGAIFGIDYLRYQNNPEYQTEKQ